MRIRLRIVTINGYKLQRTYKVYTGFPGGEIRGGRYGHREKGRYVCGYKEAVHVCVCVCVCRRLWEEGSNEYDEW